MKLKIFLLFFVLSNPNCQSKGFKKIEGYYENGNPRAVYYYVSAKQMILLKKEIYYENGQLKLSGSYKDDRKNGQWIYYYENGVISDESWFKDGELHGRSNTFYKNGKQRSSGFYRNGQRVREWGYFDEDGRLIKKIKFSDD